LSTRRDRIEICDHDSSVELDQVLKDQLTSAISARLRKQSTFRKPAKFDRRETEIFRKGTNKADFVAASRAASMSSMGLFAPIGEVRHEVGAGTCQGLTNR
jgi:hypothetical protein